MHHCKITSGPSRKSVMIALFSRMMANPKRLIFVLEEFEHPRVVISVNGIRRDPVDSHLYQIDGEITSYLTSQGEEQFPQSRMLFIAHYSFSFKVGTCLIAHGVPMKAQKEELGCQRHS